MTVTFTFEHRFTLPSCYQLRQISRVVFPEKESLLIAQQIFLVMILEREAS